MSLLKTVRGGKSVEFALNGGVLMGTAPGCQIVVADPAAAPKHCRIARGPQGYVLTDLSGNTTVNGAKVKEHALKAGDVIQIGSEKFTFAEKAPEPVAAGVRAPAPVGVSRPGAAKPAPRPAPAPAAGAPAAPARKALPARAAGGPRKMGAKAHSTGRIQKDKSVFMLPSTPKGKAIALAVAIGLVVLGGALFMLSAGTVNSEEVVKKAQADKDAFEKIPEDQYEKRLALLNDMLANENYRKYAKGQIMWAEREQSPLRQRSELEKQAEGDAKNFLERYRAVKDDAEQMKKIAEDLHDRVVNLIDKFGNGKTSFSGKLEEVRLELRAYLEKGMGGGFPDEIPQLTAQIQKRTRQEKNFNGALVDIDAFGVKWGGENKNERLKKEMQLLRDDVKGTAKDYVNKLVADAAEKGLSKEETRKSLEAARPFLQGCTDALTLLERHINERK